MRCSRQRRRYKYSLKDFPPHPRFALQNPPSPQGEGFSSVQMIVVSLFLYTITLFFILNFLNFLMRLGNTNAKGVIFKMKKIIVLTFTLLLALALTGCTANNENINSANDNGVVSDDANGNMSDNESGNIISDTVSMVESKTDEIVSAVR